MQTVKKWIFRVLGGVFLLLVLLGLCISPLLKWVIEKYDVEILGREVLIEELRLNILNGSVYINDLVIKEKDGSTDFVKAGGFSLTLDLLKLLQGEYLIKQPLMQSLKVNIVQNGNAFNYDDILLKFADTSNVESTNDADPVKYFLRDLKLVDSEIVYSLKDYDFTTGVRHLNISSPEIAWNSSRLNFNYAFELLSGGALSGRYSMDLNKLDYTLTWNMKDLRLGFLLPFLEPYIQLKKFDGGLYSSMLLAGNLNHPDAVRLSGDVDLKNFQMLDKDGVRILENSLFHIGVDTIDVAKNFHKYNEVKVDGLYLLFEMYKDGDNWTRLMPSDTSAAMASGQEEEMNPFAIMADMLRWLAKDYLSSTYLADKIEMTNSAVEYRDFSLNDKFVFLMEEMKLSTGKLNSTEERFKVSFSSRLNKSGLAIADFSFNPRNYEELELTYAVNELPIAVFNPYMTHYVAFPFESGVIQYKSTNLIQDGYLSSLNDLRLNGPAVGDRIKNPDAMKVPLKLAVSLLKNPKGNVEIEVPVKGNLKDPEYKLGKAIWKMVGNILVKAVSAPYNLLARAVGAKEDELKDVPYTYSMAGLSDAQLKKAKTLAAALKAKPELKIIFTQRCETELEKEILASRELRKKYALASGVITSSDSSAERINAVVDSISVQDSLLMNFLNQQVDPAHLHLPFQKKACKLITKEQLDQMQLMLYSVRQKNLTDFLISEGIAVDRFSFELPEKGLASPGEAPRFLYQLKVEGGLSE